MKVISKYKIKSNRYQCGDITVTKYDVDKHSGVLESKYTNISDIYNRVYSIVNESGTHNRVIPISESGHSVDYRSLFSLITSSIHAVDISKRIKILNILINLIKYDKSNSFNLKFIRSIRNKYRDKVLTSLSDSQKYTLNAVVLEVMNRVNSYVNGCK